MCEMVVRVLFVGKARGAASTSPCHRRRVSTLDIRLLISQQFVCGCTAALVSAAMPPDRGTHLPTYEYHCPKCDATYDMRQGFDAETTQKCEQCGKGIAKRVLHAPPVVFKGSGWYVTDSKGKSSARTGSHSDSSSHESDGGSDTSSSDSTAADSSVKPDAKPASSAGSDAAAAP